MQPSAIQPIPSAPKLAVLAPKALGAAIAALRLAHAQDDEAFRKSVVDCFRTQLEDGRAQARAALEKRGKGLTCAMRLSAQMDDLIEAIYDYVATYVYPLDKPSLGERLAIVAVGGYGRGTLAPGSDIDLLFLLPYKQTPWGESIVEAMLYILWDLRLKVGHSTRSVDECLRQARDDMTVRTALLEARLLLGEASLFETLRQRFETELMPNTAREFVAAKLAERDRRISKAGSSRYLVEPNIKEGKGGLRDLNTLFWIAKYVYRVREASELVQAGLFTRQEWLKFRRCEEFLWCVRCHLHFVTGRAEERLTFDQQRGIAARLGYGSHAGLSSVERFMKHYFLVAKDVGDLTAIVCAAMEEREAKPPAMLDRFMGRLRRVKKSVPEGDFAIETDRVTISRPDAFEHDPVNLIRLFWVAGRNGLAIHPDATRAVTLSLRRIDAALRASPEANQLFLDILTSRAAPEAVLRLMNEAGVLGRFVPDFGRIVALMQFNMYHHYTVDEHLLRTIGILADLEAGRVAQELPLATEIVQHLTSRTPLYVALFLHDVAKGRDEDHSLAGAQVAHRLCPRFGLSEAETETVAWLIENHLVMSNTAQSRDLADPRTTETFAGIVQTMERLKLLLVLTVCDIRAVGPGVWNGWKGELLRTLYWETEVLLTGGHSALDRKSRIRRAEEELRLALPDWSEKEVDDYIFRHYPAYWLKVDLPRKVQHARLLRKMGEEGQQLATQTATDAFRGKTELTIVAADHPRLLSIFAGSCAAAGANIVDAQIFTTTDGLALDTIVISRAFDMDNDELRRATRVTETMERALRGQIRLTDLIAARASQPRAHEKTFALAPQVTIDNSLSHRFTVLEISGLDRPGLLYDLTMTLSRLNLNIGSAHIVTFGEKAVDVFYVTDLLGAKITNPARQGAIRRHVLEIFASPPEKTAKASAVAQ